MPGVLQLPSPHGSAAAFPSAEGEGQGTPTPRSRMGVVVHSFPGMPTALGTLLQKTPSFLSSLYLYH